MHKYWGKKPSKNLNELIENYSEEGDLLLDPFAGYGVFCIESYILNRKVILNDLNPIATFIQENVLERDINIEKLKIEFNKIREKVEEYINSWFTVGINGHKKVATSVLRNKDNTIIKCKYKDNGKNYPEYTFSENEINEFKKFEENFNIKYWVPINVLFENSRITVKKGTQIKDLFTKRTLDSHSLLYDSIIKYSSGNERKLLLLAFTANLANCSRLVPPIKSRGEMAPGAWMTGFYTGETYLENNVIHYFENRVKKIIKGKESYLNQFNNLFSSVEDSKLGKRKTYDELITNPLAGYLVLNNDIKNLPLPDESIDYIFTDPPYGDSVPYFEQSIIWNSWHNFKVDYDNEIIISNSNQRKKDKKTYSSDIGKAIKEIYRILKYNKYFSITFHSLSGLEWNSLNNACLESGFALHDFQWLVQKTFTPRQLNRIKTVKGDILITFKKVKEVEKLKYYKNNELREIIENWIYNLISDSPKETNDIFLFLVEQIYKERIVIEDINFFDVLSSCAIFNDNKWRIA